MDIVLYGCNTATGAAGTAFIKSIAAELPQGSAVTGYTEDMNPVVPIPSLENLWDGPPPSQPLDGPSGWGNGSWVAP